MQININGKFVNVPRINETQENWTPEKCLLAFVASQDVVHHQVILGYYLSLTQQ